MCSTAGGIGGGVAALPLGMVATDMSKEDNVGAMGVGEGGGWGKIKNPCGRKQEVW